MVCGMSTHAKDFARENVGRRHHCARLIASASSKIFVVSFAASVPERFCTSETIFQNAMMSTFSVISPILRRGGTIPSWTCRACLRSQKQTSPARQFAEQQCNSFATRINPITRAPDGPVGGAARPTSSAAPKGKSKRRRRLLITGGAFTIGAAALTISDDAKHAKMAVERSYRVLGTLALNVKEWVGCLICPRPTITDNR